MRVVVDGVTQALNLSARPNNVSGKRIRQQYSVAGDASLSMSRCSGFFCGTCFRAAVSSATSSPECGGASIVTLARRPFLPATEMGGTLLHPSFDALWKVVQNSTGGHRAKRQDRFSETIAALIRPHECGTTSSPEIVAKVEAT